MMLINGVRGWQVAVADRGFQYGDGLFETVEIRHNRPLFLQQHLQRLALGCQRLRIPVPDPALLQDEVAQLAADWPRGVLKIIITRGSGGRGYRLPDAVQPTRVLSVHPFPDYPQGFYDDGVRVRYCQQPLSINPTLAGIKHLNRLEQILARAEWQDDAIQEGLLLDTNGAVIEGTMSNLFLCHGNTLITPDVSSAGIAGIVRGLVLQWAQQLGATVSIQTVTPLLLQQADSCFLTNSIIGIWPIRDLDGHRYPIGTLTRQLQQRWQNDHQSAQHG